MPAVTVNFLQAVNGSAHDATNDVLVVGSGNAARNLGVEVIDERFSTLGASAAAFRMGAYAHSILGAQGAVPGQGGNGVVVGVTAYAVTINPGTSYIEVQQSSP
jgi:hypothetical protein